MAQIVPLFKQTDSKEPKNNINEVRLEKFFLFSIAEKVFAIPALDVSEVAEYSSIIDIPEKAEIISGVVNVRSNVIPILNVRKRLGVSSDYYVNPKTKIVYLKTFLDIMIGMIVDNIDFRLINGMILPNTKSKNSFVDKDFRPAVMEENDKKRRFHVFSINDYLKPDEYKVIREVLESF